MAKRAGVSEQQLADLGNEKSALLDDREKLALRFAEHMTLNSAEIPDEFFGDLKNHFTVGAIIELATVVGIFNYFNRFNNALKVDITK